MSIAFGSASRHSSSKMDLTPQLAAHISELPSVMHSGAFRISNNMAASSASSSGLVTPINELPPSMMGDTTGPNIDSQLPMDYFDFDLSSFAMDGGLAPTGINLQAIPEVDDNQRMAANQSRTEETRRLSSSADAGTLWADTIDHRNENSVSELAQTAMASRGEMLHEQLAHFHMQSPAMFAQLNAHQSRHGGSSVGIPGKHGGVTNMVNEGRATNRAVSFGTYGMMHDPAKRHGVTGHPHPQAMPTPAQSGEILPNMHNGMVSPLPLGTGMDGNNVQGEYSMNERGDILFTPLLSPAMTNQGGSLHTSPQFSVGPSAAGAYDHQPETGSSETQRQLQAIQMQQMNLQRQLDQLQQQQHNTQYQQQTQPYVSPMINPQMQNNYGGALALTDGTPLQGPATTQSNPQEFFSPLGSPALNPIHHGVPARGRHRLSMSNTTSPASVQGNTLPPFPTSQVNDAATVSPALLPQGGGHHVQRFMNMDTNGQAYLTEWAKLLGDNATTPNSQTSEASASSPLHRNTAELSSQMSGDQAPAHHQHHRQSNPRPASTRSPALGPHRSGNGKSRPSPMIKPSQRPGRSNLGNSSSVSSSPLVTASTGSHHSPAYLNGGLHSANSTVDGSNGSGSLSPVDLSSILMPPPPVPQRRDSGMANFAPITPATLMQIGSLGSLPILQESVGTPRTVPEPQSSRRTSKSSHNQSQNQTPKADQMSLPDFSNQSHPDIARSPVKNNGPARHGGILPANTLERLRAIKPEAKTTAFKFQTKASPLLQATKNGKSGKAANEANIPPEVRKSSHKQAEQRRRDSLKAGFDELRLLLPPINAEALDPETGEPIPGSSAPRLLPKSSLVPDSNPNKAVSKVALLKYSNEYIGRLHGKVERRDNYIDLLKEAIRSCRNLAGFGPDEQLDELVDYAFEDEDEDEIPTGLAMEQEALREGKHSLSQSSPEETEEAGIQGEGQSANKRGRRNTTNGNGESHNARAKRKSLDPITVTTGSTRSTRALRKGSIPTPNVLPAVGHPLPATQESAPLDHHFMLSTLNGVDGDIDMVFEDGNT